MHQRAVHDVKSSSGSSRRQTLSGNLVSRAGVPSGMDAAEWFIRIGTSLVMLSFGTHQLWRPEPWFEYMPEWLMRPKPLSPAGKMRLHGAGDGLPGLLLVSAVLPRTGARLALVWWLSILPFAFYGGWKTGLRDRK